MAANKTTTQSQRDALQAEIARRHARGQTQEQIAAALGIRQQTVAYWLKKIDAEAAEQITDLAAERRRVWQSYREQINEAWLAWERSQQAVEVTTTEKIDADGESRMRATLRREGQVGDPAFLARIDAAEQAIRKLLGLDAPTSIRQEPVPDIDWSQVPLEIQVAFADGKIGLADVVRSLPPRG